MGSQSDDPPAEFHRDRREHGGASQRLDDDRLAELAEGERVDAGLGAYKPDGAPAAPASAPGSHPRQDETYEEERAEVFREIDKGEIHDPTKENPFPPTR